MNAIEEAMPNGFGSPEPWKSAFAIEHQTPGLARTHICAIQRETPQIWALPEGFTNGHFILSRDFWIFNLTFAGVPLENPKVAAVIVAIIVILLFS